MKRIEMQQIMQDYGDYLVRLAYVYVKSWSEAEEIVQDVFVKFFEKGSQFEGKSSLKTYLAKMTINKSCDYLRSVKGRFEILRSKWKEPQIELNSPESRTLALFERNQVAKAVLELPIKYREVIVLYYYCDYTSGAIASILGIPENTVKTRLKRAKEKLKVTLEPIDGEVSFYE